MKTKHLIIAAAIFLTGFACASSPSGNENADKPGKALVRSLPADIQGADLVGDSVRIKDGFQWVKQPDGTVSVRRAATEGGGDFEGTFRCFCDTGPYACEAVITDDETSIKCQYVRDCLSCKMEGWKKPDLKTTIIAY